MHLPRLLLVFAAFLLLVLTKPEYYMDTVVYVNEIVLASKQEFPPGLNPLWEFGHLLWRPLGSWGWRVIDGLPFLQEQFNETQRAYIPFVVINIVTGIIGILLMYALALRLTGNAWRAFVASAGLLASHSYLAYIQTGSAYNPGITAILASVYLADQARRSEKWMRLTAASGFFLALGILLWLPYVFAAPAVALFLALPFPDANEPRPSWRERLKPVLFLTLVTLLTGVAAYAWAVKENRITSTGEFMEWAGKSSHGVSQTKRLLRLPTALPRSVVHVGEDGMMLKRFVLKDPYAPVTITDLLRLSVFKMAIFYGALFLLLYALSRTQRGRWTLSFLFLTAGINIFFAVVLFEPSGVERYMPSFPFLWLAVAMALETGRRTEWALCGAILLMTVNNTHALSPSVHGSQDDVTFARRALLRDLPSGSQIVLVNFKDELWRQQFRLPFHPEMKNTLPVYDVLETGTAQAEETWRPNWAAKCLRAFQENGEVWMSERLFQDRPQPHWKWVEGDQPGVTWTDFPKFFGSYEYGEKRGGEDGFRRLLPSPSNLERMNALVAARKAH
jgi:hypothetical protein